VVAHLLRLRLDLLLGAVRGDVRHKVRIVAMSVLLVAVVVLVGWALVGLEEAPAEIASVVTVIGAAAVTTGFFIAPLLGGPDDPLDPRRFAPFGLEPRPLAGAVLVASIVSAPVLAVIAVTVSLSMLWAAHGVPVVAGILSALLGIVTCLLLARVAHALFGRLIRQRRSRELTGVLLIGLVVVIVPLVVFFSSLEWRGRVPSQLEEAAEILAVTPVGAAWSIPWRMLDGDAGWPVFVAIASVLALAATWVALVQWLLTTTERPLSARAQRGLGWFAVTPGTPTGAIAARSLVYWLRDSRYIVNVVVVPIGAVLTMVPLVVAGVPLSVAALLPAPLMALFFGWLVHNDLAYDSTALWMHIASAVRGVSDRVGRLVPVTLIALPLLAVAVPVTVLVHGRWVLLPAMIGVCASLFLTGLGLSSISSALSPYPAARPGDGPFEQPQRSGGSLSQGVVLLGAVVISAPVLWWGWLAMTDGTDHSWVAFWGGLGIGFGALLIGVVLGGWIFERRSGRLMEFAEAS